MLKWKRSDIMKKSAVGLAVATVITSVGIPQIVFGKDEQGNKNVAEKSKLSEESTNADLAEKLAKYEEAKAQTMLKEKAKAEADQELEEANKALATGKEALELAQQAKAEADKNAEQSAENIKKAQKRYDDAQQQYNLGSAGFFKYLDDSDADLAYDIITATNKGLQDGKNQSTDYSGYTILGDANDATNLENMKIAMDSLDKVNECRQSENTSKGTSLSDLKVTSSLMAISQYQANYAKSHFGYSGAFNVEENLSWGTASPFNRWYRDEKQIFDAGASGETGHYLTIVNPSYTVMGYSYLPKSEISSLNTVFKHVYGQTFSSDGSKYASNAISVTEYKGKFNKYYNDVKQELADAKKALDETPSFDGSKTSEQIEAEEQLELAQDAYDEAVLAVDQAKENATAKAAELDIAKANEAALKKAYQIAFDASNNLDEGPKDPSDESNKSDLDTQDPSDEDSLTALNPNKKHNSATTEAMKTDNVRSVNTGIEWNIGGYIVSMAIAGSALLAITEKQKRNNQK